MVETVRRRDDGSKYCVKCTYTIGEDWLFCPNCSSDITSFPSERLLLRRNNEVEVLSLEKELYCAYCSFIPIEKEWNHCPSCNSKLKMPTINSMESMKDDK